jgi:alpha-beta hydrolase superfamily lysophospholipase
MIRQDFNLSGADGPRIACYRWPATRDNAVGIVQVSHGMGEHALRYARVAEFLGAAGYHVYANDHRGHGRTAGGADHHGDLGRGGWNALVDEMAALTKHARTAEKGLPLVLLGHSMGSFAAQQYLLDYSELIDGAILSGSRVADTIAIDSSRRGDLTSLNAEFEPARTPFDWLSRDNAEVDKYIADPRCGFGLNAEGMRAMAESTRRTADLAELARIRKDLPIYIFAGEEDPVNQHLAALRPLAARYRAAGIKDVVEKYYPGGRHEMLNEINRDEVFDDVLNWLTRRFG